MDAEITRLAEDFIRRYGRSELSGLLRERLEGLNKDKCLTIISDDSLHSIPQALIVGERFVFSTGTFPSGSSDQIKNYIEMRVLALAEFVRGKQYTRVRLIFSGHAILPAIAKSVIYRLLHIETEDLLYFGGAGYVELHLKIRELLSK